MSKSDKFLERLLTGSSDANIRFAELRSLLIKLGFAERVRGGHHIFTKEGIAEILNLQPRGKQAKPYQVKQVRNVIVAYKLIAEKDTTNDKAQPEQRKEADRPDHEGKDPV